MILKHHVGPKRIGAILIVEGRRVPHRPDPVNVAMMHHEDRIERRLGARHEPAHEVVHEIMWPRFEGALNAAIFTGNPRGVEGVLNVALLVWPARPESFESRLAENGADDA